MTADQKDMLQTLDEHHHIPALSYRLTFTPELAIWAKNEGYVERVRSTYRLTGAGRLALSLSRPSQNSEAK